MNMLVRDQEVFTSRYPDAAAFVLAAELRRELYVITGALQAAWPPYRRARVLELLQAPACREPWFVAQLRDDRRDLQELLEEAGL